MSIPIWLGYMSIVVPATTGSVIMLALTIGHQRRVINTLQDTMTTYEEIGRIQETTIKMQRETIDLLTRTNGNLKGYVKGHSLQVLQDELDDNPFE